MFKHNFLTHLPPYGIGGRMNCKYTFAIMVSTLIIFSTFIIPKVNAGNEIIDYMANIIYNDCKGQDIDASTLGLVYTDTNVSIPIIYWPYDYSTIRRVVELIIEKEPYNLYVGGGSLKLLNCSEKRLEVNFYTYKWKGERLDPFQYNINQIYQNIDRTVAEKVNQIAIQGSGNVVDVSEVQQEINNLNQSFTTQLESNFLKINGEINNSKISIIDTLNVEIIIFLGLNVIITISLIALENKFKFTSRLSKRKKSRK